MKNMALYNVDTLVNVQTQKREVLPNIIKKDGLVEL